MTSTLSTQAIPAQPAGAGPRASGEDDGELEALAVHTWTKHLDGMTKTSFWAIARRLPAIVKEAVSIGWQASKHDTIAAIGLNLGAGVMTTLGLLATSGVLRQLFAAGPTPDRVNAALPALILAAAAVMARGGLTIAAGWAQARLIPRINLQAELRLFQAVTKVRQEAFDSHGFAQDMDRARDRGTAEAASIVDGTVNLTTGVVGVAATAVAVGVIEPILLPCLLLVALPSAVTAIRMARREYLAMLARITRRRRMWMLAILMANRHTAAEIRHFEMRGFLLAEYERIMKRETASQMDLARQQTRTRLFGVALGGLALFGLYGLLGVFLLDGAIPLAAAGMALLAVQMARTSLGTAIHATNSLYEDALYYTDYADFIARCGEYSPRDGGQIASGFDHIELRGVSLRYPESDKPAVDEVSLTIARGEVVALVGENGSGKSSLAKLLSGLYQPTSGSIFWNGADTTELDPASLVRLVSVVSQDWWKFPFTAWHNVALGRNQHHHDTADVEHAAQLTAADHVVAGLPHGWKTLLSKEFRDGHDISSGQWQRLVAARGFYRDAPLLICDEPSAALDARAEHTMFAQMRKRPDRAVVLITHRLANVRHADRIIVLNDGRVTEQGSHDQLMANGGLYAELWNMQAAGYLSGPGQP